MWSREETNTQKNTKQNRNPLNNRDLQKIPNSVYLEKAAPIPSPLTGLKQWLSRCVPTLCSSISRNLLEMQALRPCPRCAESCAGGGAPTIRF